MKRVGPREIEYALDVLSGEFRASGYRGYTAKLEAAFGSLCEAKYAITFVNGTATMHAALEAAAVGIGDEVIVPALTMSSTAFSVLHAGASPVFADVKPDTFQISAREIEKVRTAQTRAVIPVSLYGSCPALDEVCASASGLFMIQDNAEALDIAFKGHPLSAFGNCASYSFQSSKHLTAGEGGILVTNDESLADRIRSIQSLGYSVVSSQQSKIPKELIQQPHFPRHETLGWNYRMSELLAAVCLAQVERADELIHMRRQMSDHYASVARGTSILRPQSLEDGASHSYWTWVAALEPGGPTWHEFRDTFVSNGGHGIYAPWRPAYLEPAFQNMRLLGREQFLTKDAREQYQPGLCPVAESLQSQLLQFKTSVWDPADQLRQADALYHTVEYFR